METLIQPQHSDAFTKAKFTYGNVRRDATKYLEKDPNKMPLHPDQNPSPPAIKSGEVFRTTCGKFSFVCTYCRSVWRNCDLLMIHINSHFKAKNANINKTETRLASPEFVSIGVVKTEPGVETQNDETVAKGLSTPPPTPTIGTDASKTLPKQPSTTAESSKLLRTPQTIESDRLSSPATGANFSKSPPESSETKEVSKLPTTTRIVRVVKRTNDLNVAMALLKDDPNEATDSGDKSKPHRTRRIIKVIKRNHSTDNTKLSPNTILKLKPVIRPSQIANRSGTVDLTTDFDDCVMKLSGGEPQNRSSGDGEDSDPKRKVYVRRSCYQCDMDPRINKPCDPRRHRCPLCPLYFRSHDEFYIHVRDIHKEDPAFVPCQYYYCYACELRYPFRQHLAAHVKSHLGDPETYLCAICGSNFATRKKFMVHMDNHSERKFKCENCGKAFKHLWVLRQHLLCHNDCSSTHVCEICSKVFKLSKYLKRHMAVHDEPKISCRHCDAKFHFSSVRRAHEQTRHNVV